MQFDKQEINKNFKLLCLLGLSCVNQAVYYLEICDLDYNKNK